MDFANLAKFSPKQWQAIYSNARINFFHGPVRSGKTTSQRFAALKLIRNAPHRNILVSGKTKDTIKRNVLDDLFSLLDAVRIRYLFNSSRGEIKVMNKVLHVVGANDESSADRIHGMTMGGWIGDEMTLHPENFVKMSLSRMSMAGAQAYWTTNPDSPFHYLKKEYLDNEELIGRGIVNPIRFFLSDNLSLDEEYLESLQLLYTGLWRKRYIEGKWVAAAGAIYDMFDPEVDGRHVAPFLPLKFDKVIAAVDYGTASVTTFGALGRNNGKWWLFREFYYDARETFRQKTNSEFADDFEQFVSGVGYPDGMGQVHPATIEIDPSATGLKVELRKRGFGQIRNADNDVIEGIRNVGDALAHDDLKFYEKCTHSIEEHSSYVWDEEKQSLGEDAPVKENDHTCDLVRYALKRHYGRPELRILRGA